MSVVRSSAARAGASRRCMMRREISSPTSRNARARICATRSRRRPRPGRAGRSDRPTIAVRSFTGSAEMIEARRRRWRRRSRSAARAKDAAKEVAASDRPADPLRGLGGQVRAVARQREPGGVAAFQFHRHRADGHRRRDRAGRGAAARARLAHRAGDHERQHGGRARFRRRSRIRRSCSAKCSRRAICPAAW